MKKKLIPIVTLFTKPDCSLCVPVKFILDKIHKKYSFEMKIVDISEKGNEKFFDLYKYDIPVVHLNGKEILRHRANESELIEIIKKEFE